MQCNFYSNLFKTQFLFEFTLSLISIYLFEFTLSLITIYLFEFTLSLISIYSKKFNTQLYSNLFIQIYAEFN